MALIAAQTPAITGTALNMVAAAGGGDTLRVSGDTYLVVRNGDASSKTVTVVRPGTEYGQANPDIAVAVAAGATTVIGPIPSTFRDTTDDLVDITYSAVTSVTVAALYV